MSLAVRNLVTGPTGREVFGVGPVEHPGGPQTRVRKRRPSEGLIRCLCSGPRPEAARNQEKSTTQCRRPRGQVDETWWEASALTSAYMYLFTAFSTPVSPTCPGSHQTKQDKRVGISR